MNNIKDSAWGKYDLYRSMMSSDGFLQGTLLLDETFKQLKGEGGERDECKAYETMLRIADSYKVKSPFASPEAFFDMYKALLQNGQMDWEMLLAAVDSKSTDIMHIQFALVQLFQAHFQPDTNSVLIVEGEKFAPYLKSMIKQFPHCKYVITTQRAVYCSLLKNVFEGDVNVKVVLSSVYEYGFIEEKFDLVLSVPNFGRRNLTENDQQFICREFEMAALENLLLHLNAGGELVIVLPARFTFAAGNIKELREFVQQMYKLEEISELPSGIFTGTGIKTYLFSITTGQTDDVTIRKYEAGKSVTSPEGQVPGGLVLADETFVMKEELEEQGDWIVDKMFAAQDKEWQKYFEVRRVVLGDVADVFRGRTVNQKDTNGNIAVVNISNLRKYDIDYEGMEHTEETERKIANYILREGDLLLPARGTAIRTAVFLEQGYICIASSNIIVIRPDEKQLCGTYLKMLFDSPLGVKLLTSAQQGTTVMNISYKDLRNMEIPLPTIESQQKIAEEYQSELKRYQDSVAEAEKRWKAVIAKLQDDMGIAREGEQ